MKYTKILILLGALLLTVSCKKDDVVAAVTIPGTTSKELFSTDWSITNNAWEINLGTGNLTGASFTMQATFSNADACSCTAILTGTQTAGSYQTTSCTSTSNVSGTNDNANCQSIFGYTANGRYTNTAGILNFCRNLTNNCTLSYH